MAFMPAAVVDGALVKAQQIRGIVDDVGRGETSILRAGALAVVPTATPSGSVVVMPGSATISGARYGTQAGSYRVTNDAALTVSVPANTSSGTRTMYVGVAIRDPQYAGMPRPTSPDSDLYLDVLVQTSPPTDRPWLPLATITMPANTGTVTSAMIQSTAPFPLARTITGGDMRFPAGDVNMSKTYVSWPLSDFAVSVPPWATKLQAVALINGVEYVGTDTGTAGVRLIWDKTAAQNGIVTSKGAGRQTVAVLGEWAVTSAQRGDAAVYLGIQAAQSAGTGRFQQDYQSQTVITWTFKEA